MTLDVRSRTTSDMVWLRPIAELIKAGDYQEARGLASYFPATPLRRLTQFMAALGERELQEADNVARGLVEEIRQVPNDFVQILVPDAFDLLGISQLAIRKQYFFAGYISLEVCLLRHPQVVQDVISGFRELALQALLQNNIEIGTKCLDRIVEIDESPQSRIRCAEIALAGRRRETSQMLSERANSLISQAVDRLAEDDIASWLRVAKLWAVDQTTIAKALQLLERVLQRDPSLQAKVTSILLPLVDYKPYFQEIADFLIKVDPRNIAAICERLAQAYEKSRNSALLEKARQLLDTESCLAQTYYAEYARSVLAVARVSGNYTLYARRLLERKVPSDVCLEMVQALMETEPIEYPLVEWFLEQTLEQDPSSRLRVLVYWARLYDRAQASPGRRTRFLARTIAVAHGFEEFAQYGLRGDLAHKLKTIAEAESLLNRASWYNAGVAEDTVRSLIETASASERRSAVQKVLRSAQIIPVQKRAQWLMWLFAADMELSGEDLQEIYAGLRSFPPLQREALRAQLLDSTMRYCQQLVVRVNERLAAVGEKMGLANAVLHDLDEAIGRVQQRIHHETQSPEPDVRLVELSKTVLRTLRSERETAARVYHVNEQLLRVASGLSDFISTSRMGHDTIKIVRLANLLDEARWGLHGAHEVDNEHPHLARLEIALHRFARPLVPTSNSLETLMWDIRKSDLRSEVNRFWTGVLSAWRDDDYDVYDVADSPGFHRDWPRLIQSAEYSEAVKGSARAESKTLSQEEQLKSTTVERHTRIDFPSECILERKVDLRIQLTREAPTYTRAPQTLLVAFSASKEQVILDVHVTAPSFAVHQPHKTMTVPIGGDSEQVSFTLVPLEIGEQVVEIEFFHNGTRIGYVLVKTNVRTHSASERPNNVLSMEDPISRLDSTLHRAVSREKRIIHVSWIEREKKLYFTLYSSIPDEFGEWEQPVPSTREQIENDLRELNAFLSEMVTQGNLSEADWESTCLNCQAVGESLFEALIPRQLADCSRQWAPGSSVVISTNEQWIPWELMHDGLDFWVRKFIVTRYPRLSDRRNVPRTSRNQDSSLRPIRRIVNVVGGSLPNDAAKRAAGLFAKLPSSVQVTLLEQQPIIELKKAVDGADILHCTCHGLSDPHLLQIASDRTRTKNLLPHTVKELPLCPGGMVFANACASAQPYIAFGKFGSFGWEFYKQGADVFIGTLGPIPTKYAIPFAEMVYDRLTNRTEQSTIGIALANARKEAADQRNLFWLLYCLYGDPDYSMSVY